MTCPCSWCTGPLAAEHPKRHERFVPLTPTTEACATCGHVRSIEKELAA